MIGFKVLRYIRVLLQSKLDTTNEWFKENLLYKVVLVVKNVTIMST